MAYVPYCDVYDGGGPTPMRNSRKTLLVKVVFWNEILSRFQKFNNFVVFENKNRRNELKVETASFILVPMRAPNSQ